MMILHVYPRFKNKILAVSGFLLLFLLTSINSEVFGQCNVCATCTTASTGCDFSVSTSSSQNFSFKANVGGKMCILGGTYTGNVTIVGGNNNITIVVAPGAVFSPASITYGVFINGSFTLEVKQGGTAILPPWALAYNGSVTIRNCGVIQCTGELLLPGAGTGNGNVTIQNNGLFTVAGTLKLGTNGNRTICNSDTMHLGSFFITGNISSGVTNNGYIQVDSNWTIAGTNVSNTLCPNSLILVKGNWNDNSRTSGSNCGKVQVWGTSVCNSCRMTGVWDFCDTTGAAAAKSYPTPKVDTVKGFSASWAPTVTYCNNCILSSSAPVVSLNAGNLCAGSCFSLTSGVTGGTPPFTYKWSPNIGTTAGPISVCPNVTTTYTLVVTDAVGLTGSATSKLIVNLLPNAVTSANTTLCAGSSTKLSASGGVTYSWAPSGSLSNPAIANPVANPIVTTTYTVTVTDSLGCSDTATVTLTVIPPPIVNITHSPLMGCDSNTIYIGYGPQSVTLTANSSGSAIHYQWYLNGAAIAGDTTKSIVVNTGGWYNVIVTAGQDCLSDSTNAGFRISAIDARCGHDLKKVLLCHAPDCRYNRAVTLCIPPSAVVAHLKNHSCDCIGPCPTAHHGHQLHGRMEDEELSDNSGIELIVVPNPFTNEASMQFSINETAQATLEIFDIKGTLVKTVFSGVAEANTNYNLKLDGSAMAEGIYIIRLSSNDEVIHQKLVLTK